MTIRKFLSAALVVAAVTANVYALTPEHTEFGKGPAQYFMTKDELAKWKKIRTDEEAQAFIDLFWARRDPSPGTPQNELHDEFDAKVKYADEKFPAGKKRGSMSDRGRVFMLFGVPSRIQRTATEPTSTIDDRGFNLSVDNNRSSEKSSKQIWFYDGDVALKNFNAPTARINFLDQFNMNEFTIERGQGAIDDKSAQQRMIEKLIVQPQLTVAPVYGAAAAPIAAAATPVAVAPATAVMTELATAAIRDAVEQVKSAQTNPYDKPVYAAWGEYVTAQGEYYVPVSLYVPASAGLKADQTLTFFGAIEDESGKKVAVFEQPAKLSVTKDNLYVDKSLTLPAGKFRGVFGLAENGKPIAVTKSEMTLAGTIDKDAPAASPLLLSDDIHPMSAAQEPTEPFAFGGIKVIPKATKTFLTTDEIWYFFELRNPGLTEANAPKVQMKVDVETIDEKGQKRLMSAPPREVDAIELQGVPGHYGVGSSLPPNTFPPGKYTIRVKATDTVRKASYTLQDSFTVVAAK